MTDDIVTRLRLWASVTEGDHVIEELHRAADEIERLQEDRDKWKSLFIEMYSQGAGVTDEMMWAYRKEMGKA